MQENKAASRVGGDLIIYHFPSLSSEPYYSPCSTWNILYMSRRAVELYPNLPRKEGSSRKECLVRGNLGPAWLPSQKLNTITYSNK